MNGAIFKKHALENGKKGKLMQELNAEKWLEEHINEIPSEEIIDEVKNNGFWPIPEKVKNLGIFSSIDNPDKFNEILGNPQNWEALKLRKDVYYKWVLPLAINLFGKKWFDNVKYKARSSFGMALIFNEYEIKDARENCVPIEDTSYGRAAISKIIIKISHALDIYLKGGWIVKGHRTPGSYLVESIKNEFISEFNKELGNKIKQDSICPNCLMSGKKIVVEKNNEMCSCPRCSDIAKTLENTNDEKLKQTLKLSKIFTEFSEIVIICKNDNCHGKFIPLNLLNVSIPKIAKKSFVRPAEEIACLDITCPFCNETFKISDALKGGGGFKNKSGHLTTLPVLNTWSKKDILILDESDESNFKNNKNKLVNEDTNKINEEIIYKQKAGILINELLINLKRTNNKSITNLSTKCFLLAATQWIRQYQYDAINYFFENKQQKRKATEKEKEIYKVDEKKYTKVFKGNEATIHQTIFNLWINEIEKNISEFTKIDKTINKVEDLKWFNKKINNENPRKTFKTTVSKSRITSKNEIVDVNSIFVPKIVKVYSIAKVDENNNVIENIKDFMIDGWQGIIINSKVEDGDIIIVDALFMSGHPTNAPTQRIIRLRKNILSNIVNKIKEEEKSGEIDEEFWNNWRNAISLLK